MQLVDGFMVKIRCRAQNSRAKYTFNNRFFSEIHGSFWSFTLQLSRTYFLLSSACRISRNGYQVKSN